MDNKKLQKVVGQAVDVVSRSGGARKATYFDSPEFVVKATAQRRVKERDCSATTIVTIGKPNYEEREFIKLCRQAGESFPIKKLQLKFWK